jgi:hypothetical protein
MERARFVARLAQGKLEASACSQTIVRDIIRLESRDRVLYRKTGWCVSGSSNIGWWMFASRDATGRQASRQHSGGQSLGQDLAKGCVGNAANRESVP